MSLRNSIAVHYLRKVFLQAFGVIAALSVIPTVLSMAGISVLLPGWAWTAGLIFCLLVANYHAYKEAFEKYHTAGIDVTIDHAGCGIDGSWETSIKTIQIHDRIYVKVNANLALYNGTPIVQHIQFSIQDIKSDWVLAVPLKDIDLDVRHGRGTVQRISITPKEMIQNVRVEAKIPFEVPENDRMRYLGNLSELTLMLLVEPSAWEPLELSIQFEVSEIKNRIEDRLKSLIRHNQFGDQALELLRPFWVARESGIATEK